LELPVNVDGYLPLVENLPSGRAMKLGDVLLARNGKTIEIHNTDAEGRLILADALAYAVDDKVDHGPQRLQSRMLQRDIRSIGAREVRRILAWAGSNRRDRRTN
jgi:hypothetical protein